MMRSRLAQMLRLLPALVWVAVQFSMATPVLASPAEAEETRILSVLGLGSVTLCSPLGAKTLDPDGDAPVQTECPWCQTFEAVDVPRVSDAFTVLRLGHAPAFWPSAQRQILSHLASLPYESRAPPV